jgi:hypothetical protein
MDSDIVVVEMGMEAFPVATDRIRPEATDAELEGNMLGGGGLGEDLIIVLGEQITVAPVASPQSAPHRDGDILEYENPLAEK